MTGANFSSWFNNATGTFAVDVSFPTVSFLTYNGRLFELSSGVVTNFLALLPLFVSNQYQFSSTIAGIPGVHAIADGATAAGALVRVCTSYGTNRAVCVNTGTGASAVNSTPGGIATVSQINLGNRSDNLRGGAIHMRRMRFWPRVLSDAEMQGAVNA
jgi:hypothetical protein